MPKNLKYVYYPEKKVYILAKTSKDEFLSDPADSKGTAIVHRSTEKNNMERLYKSRSSFKITNISEQSKSKWATILYGAVFPVSDLSNVAKNNNKGGGTVNFLGTGNLTVNYKSTSTNAYCYIGDSVKINTFIKEGKKNAAGIKIQSINCQTYQNQTEQSMEFEYKNSGDLAEIYVNTYTSNSGNYYEAKLTTKDAEIISVESLSDGGNTATTQGKAIPYLTWDDANTFTSHNKKLKFTIYVRPSIGTSLELSPAAEFKDQLYDENADNKEKELKISTDDMLEKFFKAITG